MKKSTAVSSVAVAAATVALAAAPSFAATSTAAAHGTLSVRAAHASVHPHGRDVIAGSLLAGKGRVSGQKVVLERHAKAATKWSVIGTSTTGAKGVVSFVVRPTAGTWVYRLVHPSSTSVRGCVSPAVTVVVK